MAEIASCIDSVLAAIGSDRESSAITETKKRVVALSSRFPLPYRL
jgi:glycine hydroxymethyltransferase